ncbi:MAG: hypothetical protein HUU01_21940 [Saprospiraceae bacterium]|nr:hypothetical protein [Saprospiraceae bacterium]
MESSNHEYINLNYLDQVAGDDTKTRATLLDLIAKELEEIIPQLLPLYSANAWEAIKSHVHRMKTTLAFAGNAEMITANNQIWKVLVAMESPESTGPMIQTLTANYLHIVGELKTELLSMKES